MNADLMQWVESNSWRDHDTGCLVWKMGGAHGGTQPQGRFGGTIILVRRAIYEARRGRKLVRTQTVKCSCETKNCVEPAHLIAKKNTGRKGQKNNPAHRQKIADGIRSSGVAKLTIEAVEDMRSQQEAREKYAQKYGIAKEYVTDIQGYRVWRDYANPFTALL